MLDLIFYLHCSCKHGKHVKIILYFRLITLNHLSIVILYHEIDNLSALLVGPLLKLVISLKGSFTPGTKSGILNLWT